MTLAKAATAKKQERIRFVLSVSQNAKHDILRWRKDSERAQDVRDIRGEARKCQYGGIVREES